MCYLDNAIRAFNYSTSDPYRWSQKYKLLKRGYTIDTWDFQASEDAVITGAHMVVDKDKTRFGVMHGDNTGFYAGCNYLAEMLEIAGRIEDAKEYRNLGAQIKQRLDNLAWNGAFYTHHVPEDQSVQRDFGSTDTSKQVSLSNAYGLNRGLAQEQCAAIIRTYQHIRDEMPESSPGEFYQIYPPFERGFKNPKWQYMNGGVTTIVAGELAHGAFEHGFETYGTEILKRVYEWGMAHDGYLDCCYRGKMPDRPQRKFNPIDLTPFANTDFSGKGAEGVPGWTQEGANDLASMVIGSQEFFEIPFEVIDPAQNNRRACIGLSRQNPYNDELSIPIGQKATSLYFLHTANGPELQGWFTLDYADGETHTEYIFKGKQVGPWFIPNDPEIKKGRDPICKVAWRGRNKAFPKLDVGVYAYGFNNPHPEKEITDITCTAAANNAQWFILGLTCCDAPVYFPPSDISYGIPDNWGAAAVVYALIEGLAGIKDKGRSYDMVTLAPRWSSDGVTKVKATAKYEASGGYVSYDYRCDTNAKQLRIDISSNAGKMQVELLIPNSTTPKEVSLNGTDVPFGTKKVENSTYVTFVIDKVAAHSVVVDLV